MEGALISVAQDEQSDLIDLKKNQDTTILVVCSHGSSRSKLAAKVLDRFGYTNVRIMGVRDAGQTSEEKMKSLQWAKLIIPTAPDVAAEVEFNWDKAKTPEDAPSLTIVPLFMSEQEHGIATLNVRSEELENLYEEIGKRLVEAGFVDHRTKESTIASE